MDYWCISTHRYVSITSTFAFSFNNLHRWLRILRQVFPKSPSVGFGWNSTRQKPVYMLVLSMTLNCPVSNDIKYWQTIPEKHLGSDDLIAFYRPGKPEEDQLPSSKFNNLFIVCNDIKLRLKTNWGMEKASFVPIFSMTILQFFSSPLQGKPTDTCVQLSSLSAMTLNLTDNSLRNWHAKLSSRSSVTICHLVAVFFNESAPILASSFI